MIFVLLIGLYTVRAILGILGVEDYGIYNVVGGVVTIFSFINGTLATSSQRYFSIELAKDNVEGLRKQFSLNITLFLLIILFVIFILETIGLWFLNTQLTIPENRIFAANIVYQLSIISFAFQILSVPYNAMIIAYERMSTFAYIGITEALSKLLIVGILVLVKGDSLIIYGILMLATSICITGCYVGYCRKHLPGSKYFFYWNKQEVLSLFGFSGWHLLGTISVVVRSQGINLLINMFFNPAVNAARAVAYQIYSSIIRLSDSFFVAVKPEIYKAYAKKEIKALNTLIIRSTIICVFLVSLFSVPFILQSEFILTLWLKQVPAYAVLFTNLVLTNGLIDATSGPVICPALATGKIKNFYLVTGTLYILNLPLSYIALKFGCDATTTVVISIAISFLSIWARAWQLSKIMEFDFPTYTKCILKLIMITIIILALCYLSNNLLRNTWINLFMVVILSSVLHVVIYYAFILSKEEKKIISKFVKSRIK